ncbi:MAG: hypothetical protein M3R21_08070 [Candidatus Dormibacteraeota bacterium]|nr:hypothetical protein [Candidatus Dormibacteraeota bacterium]
MAQRLQWSPELTARVFRVPASRWALRLAAATTGGLLGVAFGILLADREFLALLTAILVAGALAGAVRVVVPRRVRGPFSVAMALAFAVHLAVLVVLHVALVAMGRGGFVTGDDASYARVAWLIASAARGEPTAFDRTYDGFLLGTFVYAEAAVFYLVGYQVLVAKMLLLGVGLALVIFVFDIAHRIFDEASGALAAVLVAFYPSLVVWSSLNLKDPLAGLLAGLVLWAIARFQLRPRGIFVALALLFLIPMYELRSTIYPGLLLAIVAGLVLSPRFIRPRLMRAFVVGVVGLGIAATAFAAFDRGYAVAALRSMEYQRQFMPVGARTGFGDTNPIPISLGATLVVQEAGAFPWLGTLDEASRSREPIRVVRVGVNARVASASWNGQGTSSPGDVVRLNPGDLVVIGEPTTAPAPREQWAALNLPAGTQARLTDGLETAQETYARISAYFPMGVAYALFAPVPWTIARAQDLLTAPEMLLWYLLMTAAVLTLIRFRDKWWLLLPLVLFVATFTAAMALTEGNVGTIFRHRAMIIPFVIVLAAPSLLWLGRMTLSALRRAS